MKRSSMIISAIFALTFSAVLWADDAQDIRDLITKENVSHKKGDAEAIMSCFAPGFVGYWQISDDPEDIFVLINGLDDLRTNYALKTQKQENIEPTSEVRHVSIKGDKGVAVSRHWKIVNNYPMGTHHTMWMVAKIKGQWLITGFIAGVKSDLPNVLQLYAPKQ